MLTRFATMTAVALLMAGPVVAQTATDPATQPTTPPAASPAAPETPAPADPAAPAATPAMPAAPAGEPATADTADAGGMKGEFIEAQEANQVLASEIIGSSVRGGGDESIGEINNILLDREGNKIVGAVIGVGGFLGVGEKEVAIGFAELKVTKDENGDDMLTLARTKEELEAAPEFKTLDDRESEATASAPAPAATTPAPATGGGSTVQ